MEDISEKLIDIEAVIASKNPALLRWIPKFVISYLKRITHQDEVNGYIWRNRHLSGVPFVIAILKEFGVKVQLDNARMHECTNAQMHEKENDPPSVHPSSVHPLSVHPSSDISFLSSGRYIIAANHPLGGIDGMALMQEVGRVRPDIVFPVNDLLMNVPGLRPLFIPINKHGKNTENARIIDATFASEKLVLFFPAGLVSRKLKKTMKDERCRMQDAKCKMQDENHPNSEIRDPRSESRVTSHQSRVTSHEIRDLEWKSTFIKKAKKYHRDVVPVYIGGRNSEWFYNLSRWRMRLGIKANIEMLYLVDEMAKQFGKTITLTFGNPIPYTTFDKSKTEAQWAEWVKEQVYALAHRQK